MKQNNSSLALENSQLRDENRNLKSRLDNLEGQLRNLKVDLKNDILLRKEILSFLFLGNEREKIKINLCIRNFPEPNNDSQDELPSIKQFFILKLGLRNEELSNIV